MQQKIPKALYGPMLSSKDFTRSSHKHQPKFKTDSHKPAIEIGIEAQFDEVIKTAVISREHEHLVIAEFRIHLYNVVKDLYPLRIEVNRFNNASTLKAISSSDFSPAKQKEAIENVRAMFMTWAEERGLIG